MIRLLVADDHGLVRRGIAQIVSESEDIRVAGEASSGEEALDMARSGGYDVALLDITMPGRGGLDVIRDIRAACPMIKVIVVSMHPEEQYAVRSLRDGASAYLTKASADRELVAAIRKVAGGGRYITLAVAERLAIYVDDEAERPAHDSLSPRELQVLRLFGSGMTAGEIARELSLSVKTVSAFRARTLAKLGLRTSAQLIKYAIDRKLVP